MGATIGVTDNHDSGACLFVDNKLVYAVNEERLNREKLTRKFPDLSIKECLKRTNESKITYVVASKFTPISLLRLFNKKYALIKHRSQYSYFVNLYFLYQTILRKFKLTRIESFLSKIILKNKLKKYSKVKDIILVDHHKAHAYSALNTSGFKESLVITVDAMGDGLSLTVGVGKNNRLNTLYQEFGDSAISLYYSRITELLGFRSLRHEGKVLGLSCYGNYTNTIKYMKKLMHYNGNGGFNKINHMIPLSKNKGIYKKISKFKREDVAAGLQKNLETEFIKFVKYWMEKTGQKNICLSGGIFANVKLNQSINEISDKIYIFPHMGDGGLAVGAVCAYLKKSQKVDNLYLGNNYNDEYVKYILDEHKINYTKPNNLAKFIAQLLSRNKVVALFQGRMEFGPRALGNRSILYRPNDPDVNDWLNKKLKRTEFMPFAPVVLNEDAKKCFKDIDINCQPAKNMIITYECTDWMKKKCSGVVHIDGSARPQLIDKKTNPLYYNIVKEFKKITGLPCIINTSFNMHEEPIVCSPNDALRAFIDSKLDYLVINKFLISNHKENLRPRDLFRTSHT